ncbi:type I restriction enzyme M protein [Agromyces cerinus]|uniref:N-6 DNA methylase n=1 Tax=Agromyces cerinus TaxID=33878 RepID=UPI00195D641D|nr:N-6 DNA methylase [Agromyces cerinus]MBM7832062.1 type I restriction enzyme M protein [Agromyces cerinus]
MELEQSVLLAEAIEQGTTGHGLRSFTPEQLSELDLRVENETLQVFCFKRKRWLKAKPEEIVRQLVLRRMVTEMAYPLSRIAVEWPIQMGSDAERQRADIVVFNDDAHTDPYIIVEVKRPKVGDGIEQLRSYLRWTGCFFGTWSNGDDAVHVLREEDPSSGKGPYTFRDIPRVPKNGESLDEVLKPLTPGDLRPVQDLRALVERLEHDALSNAGVGAFDELLKLFFAKIHDEIRTKAKAGDPCRFRASAASDEQLHQRIDGLFQEAKKRPGASDLFDAGEQIKLTSDALRLCTSVLEPFTLAHSNLEVMDAAFEYLVNPEQKGQKGQYFTPRPVVKMAVEMLNPQDGEKVIDPACGSGGFLIHSLMHVRDQNDWAPADGYKYANENLFGADFDDKLVRVAKMSMIVAGDGKTNIVRVNSLDVRDWQNSKAASMIGPFTKTTVDGDFDMVLTNPPFSGKVSGRPQLIAYDLFDMASQGLLAASEDDEEQAAAGNGATGRNRRVNSMQRDILFLERSLDLLKPGGRMAIVLPQGNLNNIGLAGLRNYVLGRARLLAVVGLHYYTFRPFASIKTSVVFLQKWGGAAGDRLDDYPVFMAVSSKPGKDNRGRYVYRTDEKGRLLDADGRAVVESDKSAAVDSDLDEIASAFLEWKKTQGLGF